MLHGSDGTHLDHLCHITLACPDSAEGQRVDKASVTEDCFVRGRLSEVLQKANGAMLDLQVNRRSQEWKQCG